MEVVFGKNETKPNKIIFQTKKESRFRPFSVVKGEVICHKMDQYPVTELLSIDVLWS